MLSAARTELLDRWVVQMARLVSELFEDLAVNDATTWLSEPSAQDKVSDEELVPQRVPQRVLDLTAQRMKEARFVHAYLL